MIGYIISLVIMYMVFSIAYVWLRRDEQGERVYAKELGFYGMVVVGIVLFLVNITIFI